MNEAGPRGLFEVSVRVDVAAELNLWLMRNLLAWGEVSVRNLKAILSFKNSYDAAMVDSVLADCSVERHMKLRNVLDNLVECGGAKANKSNALAEELCMVASGTANYCYTRRWYRRTRQLTLSCL